MNLLLFQGLEPTAYRIQSNIYTNHSPIHYTGKKWREEDGIEVSSSFANSCVITGVTIPKKPDFLNWSHRKSLEDMNQNRSTLSNKKDLIGVNDASMWLVVFFWSNGFGTISFIIGTGEW